MSLHYVNEIGAYCGSAEAVPEGFYEVPSAPEHGSQRWDRDAQAWGTIPGDVQAARVRAERDARIKAVAWRVERSLSEARQGLTPSENVAALDAYVQALRDVPAQDGFPLTVVWPELP